MGSMQKRYDEALRELALCRSALSAIDSALGQLPKVDDTQSEKSPTGERPLDSTVMVMPKWRHNVLAIELATQLFDSGVLPTSSLFDEEKYMERNIDVAQAVAKGSFPSGYVHWVLHGSTEGREIFVLDGGDYSSKSVISSFQKFVRGKQKFSTRLINFFRGG